MLIKLFAAYGAFTVLWFLVLLVSWFFKTLVIPPIKTLFDYLIWSSVIKIAKSPLSMRREIFRNFGYGLIFSGGFGVVFLLLSVLSAGVDTTLTILILCLFTIVLVIIGLKMIASSV